MEQSTERPTQLQPTSMDTEDSVVSPRERYEKLKNLSKEAVEATHKAMDSDERNEKTVACGQYNIAVGLLDYAISYTKSWEYPEEEKQAVAMTRINLQKNRDNILDRLKVLQAETGRDDSLSYLYGPPVNPISSPSELRNRMPPPYVEDGPASSGALSPNFDIQQASPVEAREVFSIPENIQIYFISRTDENVSAPSYPSFLRIVVIDQEESESEPTESPAVPKPSAFLQVGDWTYPLIPRQSPVYKASPGSYIFPDLNSPGSSIGLVFPTEVSDAQRAIFDDILLQLLGLRQLPTAAMLEKERAQQTAAAVEGITVSSPENLTGEESDVVSPETKSSELNLSEESTSTVVAASLVSGAEQIAKGIVYSAQKTSEYISAGANYIIDRINPVEKEPTVKPQVKTTVRKAKYISGKAVKVSGYIVNQVGRGTVLLGRTLAPYIQSTSAKMYAKATVKSDEEARRSVDGAFEVAAGCAVGLGTVYMGLEEGAKILGRSLGNNSVKIIDKRFGQGYGNLATDGVSAIGNTVTAGYNVHCLGPKSLAKRAVKDAAITAITDREGFVPKPVPSTSNPAVSTITVSSGETGTIASPAASARPDPPQRPAAPPRKHK